MSNGLNYFVQCQAMRHIIINLKADEGKGWQTTWHTTCPCLGWHPSWPSLMATKLRHQACTPKRTTSTNTYAMAPRARHPICKKHNFHCPTRTASVVCDERDVQSLGNVTISNDTMNQFKRNSRKFSIHGPILQVRDRSVLFRKQTLRHRHRAGQFRPRYQSATVHNGREVA